MKFLFIFGIILAANASAKCGGKTVTCIVDGRWQTFRDADACTDYIGDDGKWHTYGYCSTPVIPNCDGDQVDCVVNGRFKTFKGYDSCKTEIIDGKWETWAYCSKL